MGSAHLKVQGCKESWSYKKESARKLESEGLSLGKLLESFWKKKEFSSWHMMLGLGQYCPQGCLELLRV